MAKKAKKKAIVKKQYSNGWETRRANAAKLGVSPHKFVSKRAGGIEGFRANEPLLAVASRHKARLEQGMRAAGMVDPSPAVGSALNQSMQRMGDELAKALYRDGKSPDAPVDAETIINDRLMALARKKDGAEEFAAQLAIVKNDARYQGQAEVKDVQARTDEKIVCGFVATVELGQRIHGGLPTSLMFSLTSFEATKIVDALNRAGYSASGRNEGVAMQQKREAIMGKSHAQFNRGSTG